MIPPAPPAAEHSAWLAQPSPDDIARAEGLYATRKTAAGRSTLVCTVLADGRLGACSVDAARSDPAFEAAMLSLRSRYRLDVARAKLASVEVSVAFPKLVDTEAQLLARPLATDVKAATPLGVQGDGDLECLVTSAGVLDRCAAALEPVHDPRLDAAAMALTPSYRFRPAMLNGRPVPTWIALHVALGPHVVTSPNWERRPTAGDVGSVFPDRAARLGQSGGATLKCGVSAAGMLADCQVLAETPEGFGFGLAVLRLASKFRMRPQTVDGVPVAGGSVTIPVRFGVAARAAPIPEPNSRFVRKNTTIMAWAPWALAPSAQDVADAFPKAARQAQTYGQAALVCDLSRDGRLHGCLPTVEAADRLGFERAATTLTSKFKADVAQLPPGLTGDTKVALSFDFSARSLVPAGQRYTRQPEWVRTFDAQDMLRVYPAAAAQAGVASGVGAVDCTVGASGVLENCVSAGEDPAGMGFGAAALKLAPMMQANLWTRDGEAAVGEKIRLPLRFASTAATSAK